MLRTEKIKQLEEDIHQIAAERNELQALLVAMVIRAGGDCTIGNGTMQAACNGIALRLTQDDESGELRLRTYIADESEAS